MLKLYSRVTMQWQDQATDGNDLIGVSEEGVEAVLGEVGWAWRLWEWLGGWGQEAMVKAYNHKV